MLIVLVAIIMMCTCGVRIALDERRLSAIVPGMTLVAVQDSLGPPTDTFRAPLPSFVAPRHCVESAQVTAAALFARSWRDSLLVLLDRYGRVVCVERERIAYNVHLLRSDRW